MKVSACLVTRGDVDMQPILDSLPQDWEAIVWDNDEEFREPTAYRVLQHRDEIDETWKASNLSVYGRYAAIEYASGDLIYVQDDDVIVSDPRAITRAWFQARNFAPEGIESTVRELREDHVVCNMPPEFRHDFYREHALVGFGACFHRDAPKRAFTRAFSSESVLVKSGGLCRTIDEVDRDEKRFYRCCDVVFTALTPRVLVDVPKQNLPYAEAEDRMYRQLEHVAERKRMLDLALRVRG